MISPVLLSIFFTADLTVVLQRLSKGIVILAELVHLKGLLKSMGPEPGMNYVRRVVWDMLYEDDACIVNPSATSRVFTDHFTDHFFFFSCLARSSRVGDFKKDTRTPRARSCTAPQSSNAAPAERDNKTNPKGIRYEGMKRASRLCVVCCVDLGDIACSACRSIAGSAACFSCLL